MGAFNLGHAARHGVHPRRAAGASDVGTGAPSGQQRRDARKGIAIVTVKRRRKRQLRRVEAKDLDDLGGRSTGGGCALGGSRSRGVSNITITITITEIVAAIIILGKWNADVHQFLEPTGAQERRFHKVGPDRSGDDKRMKEKKPNQSDYRKKTKHRQFNHAINNANSSNINSNSNSNSNNNNNSKIKSYGTQPVGRTHDKHAARIAAAVELRHELRYDPVLCAPRGRRAPAVAAAAAAASRGQRVDFVQKHNTAAGGLPCPCKDSAHLALGLANVRIEELGALDGDEPHAAWKKQKTTTTTTTTTTTKPNFFLCDHRVSSNITPNLIILYAGKTDAAEQCRIAAVHVPTIASDAASKHGLAAARHAPEEHAAEQEIFRDDRGKMVRVLPREGQRCHQPV
jgi:hypothetical protein